MNDQIVKEVKFEDVVGKTDFEAALMFFQDQIPKAARDKFTVYQWVFIFDSPFLGSKTKELAWESIKEAKLTFEQSKSILREHCRNTKIRAQMLDNMCLLADKAEKIVYCLNYYLDNNNLRRQELLSKLSKVDDSFPVLAGVFHNINNRKTDIQDAVFRVIQKVEATFKQWQDFNRGFGRSPRYLLERLKAMRKRADTFNGKWQTYIFFKSFESLDALLSGLLAVELSALFQDLSDTAKNVRDLDLVYCETRSEEVKAKILTAPGDFNDWQSVNQCPAEDWLEELSLRRMRELARSFDNWSIVWCKESLSDKKNEAASKMIDLASNVKKAKLAVHRAIGTDLEKKAQEKLQQIVLALP